MANFKIVLAIVCLQTFCLSLSSSFANTVSEDEDFAYIATDVIEDKEDALLVLSTLDGSLIGVAQYTGLVRWKIQNEPAVKVPVDTKNAIVPMFLPDPKDGSLYLLSNGGSTGETNALKKLPFTIQQLVASSPCRSTDGIFYTGKKIDAWFSVNWKTGKKHPILSFDQLDKTCPVTASDTMFVGRTEYNIMMYSKNQNRYWNVTFYDYATQKMSNEDILKYDLVHFSSSSSGRVVTFDRHSGSLLWEQDYGSPLVAIYIRYGQDLMTIPFTSVEDTTLEKLPFTRDRDKLYPTLYVGQHVYGLYALPALVGHPSGLSHSPLLLIEGPNPLDHPLVLGHYQVPDYSKTRLQITGRSDIIIPPGLSQFNGSKSVSIQTDSIAEEQQQHKRLLGHDINSDDTILGWMGNLENKALVITVAALVVSVAAMFVYFRAQLREFQQLSERSSSRGSARDQDSQSDETVTAYAEQLSDGTVRVGKISFHTDNVLGKGCEGTFVFRGEFDGRAVAVKRLLPECFTVADREVCLLRESDTHAHVVRYFCTEQDKQFRYIALELCAATLQDYVEKTMYRDVISLEDTLRQATSGLHHLHSLNIVHRDIKPHNVLLSMPTTTGQVRAMISDFGLCKKLQTGRASFSRRSGITGTDGWIAPEMVHGNDRTMCAVDIFSLGCVFYYVMTGGKHPFGDVLHRQANILSGHYRLTGLNKLWESLIMKMISSEPLERPPTKVIIDHPVFWDRATILTFLQDVSDRVEKEDATSPVLTCLERGASVVCGEDSDWRTQVDVDVAADLRKYRSYRGDSVRDLLRALRNKKHHFRELSEEAQQSLGSTPESFVEYWISRFPLLLLHSWTSMQCVRSEPIFVQYYAHEYTFPLAVSNGEIPLWLLERRSELENGVTEKEQTGQQQQQNNSKPRRNFRMSPKKRVQYAQDSDQKDTLDVRHNGSEKSNKLLEFQNRSTTDVSRQSNTGKPVFRTKFRRKEEMDNSDNRYNLERELWKKSGREAGAWRPKS